MILKFHIIMALERSKTRSKVSLKTAKCLQPVLIRTEGMHHDGTSLALIHYIRKKKKIKKTRGGVL